MRPARPNSAVILTLLAWLLATGAQWDLVQVLAWARMFALNSRALPLADAIERTFSPAGRCRLCRAVTAARQELPADAVPQEKSPGKILLGLPPSPGFVVAVPKFAAWPPAEFASASQGRARPPLPPPRA